MAGTRQNLVMEKPKAAAGPVKAVKLPGSTWVDHLVMLLHIAAEIEHGLMVQYLYAAYSLGGPDVSDRHCQALVKRWQDAILLVAKEEMGHLLTVQNILTLLGAPVNLERSDYPWDTPYYPCPFSLEKLTKSSLASYVFVEMPPRIEEVLRRQPHLEKRFERFLRTDKAEIERLVRLRAAPDKLHLVAVVYDEIIDLIGDEERIPDSAFQDDTYPLQAGWDDWGRGYGPDPYLLDASGTAVGPATHQKDANLLIRRAATRTEAVAALKAISEQGEATHLKHSDKGEPSHFERFLEIYQHWPDEKDWSPTRDVASNPSVRKDGGAGTTYIEAAQARRWATLFNYRYRMLLTYLAHSFRLARVAKAGDPGLRGMAMHKVFGEMYNLKALSGILVQQPLRDAPHKKHAQFAGPPFEMPYSLTLPELPADIWRLHRELVETSVVLAQDLLGAASPDETAYLRALIELDGGTIAWINKILGQER